jgi:hypothetical protein
MLPWLCDYVHGCGCGGHASDGIDVIQSSISWVPAGSTTLEPIYGMR